jgi:predicted nucleotide-binding protein
MLKGQTSMGEVGLAARYEGEEGSRRLIELLKQQALVGSNEALAACLLKAMKLRELSPGEILIRQDDADKELYLLLSGTLRILVNGREVANRRKGSHIGEMAAIDPAARRTATVVAAEACLVAALTEANFISIANAFPSMWRAIAVELSRRLDQRKRFYRVANTTPIVFMGSSGESVTVAEALAGQIPRGIATVRFWTKGVFGPSGFPMEDLESQLNASDFAVLVAAPDDPIVFELGLFMGALGRRRTFLMLPRGGALKAHSDIPGLTPVYYDDGKPTPAAQTQEAAGDLIELVKRIGPK